MMLMLGSLHFHFPLKPPNRPLLLLKFNRFKHSVRVILVEDLPGGRGYAGEVHSVAAGYARNFLIPTKKALYANETNFQRVGMVDPLLSSHGVGVRVGVGVATSDQPQASQVNLKQEDDQYAKAADFLRYYLRNKILKIWRNVDSSTTTSTTTTTTTTTAAPTLAIYPGMVDAAAVRQKLATQLKIDLDSDEFVQISSTPVTHDLIDGTTSQGQDNMNQLLKTMFQDRVDMDAEPKVQIRQLGDYLAKIHLKGQHAVGLRFSILKR